MVVQNATPLSTRTLYEVIVVNDVTDLAASPMPWVLTSNKGHGLLLGPISIDPEKFLRIARPHDLTRPMTQEEESLLTTSILNHGVKNDIYVNVTGKVVDGYHRVRICCKLHLKNKTVPPIPTRFVKFRDKAAESEFVMAANLARRHLTTDDKKKFIADLLIAGCDYGDNALAKKLSLATGTITPVRESLEDAGAITRLANRRGLDNKFRPVKTGKRTGGKKKSAAVVRDQTYPLSDPGSVATQPVDGDELSIERPAAVGSDENLSASPPELPVKATDQSITRDVEDAPDPADTEDLESDPEMNEDDKLLAAWWACHGIEPVASSQLFTACGGSGKATQSDITKIGCQIGRLLKAGHHKYTIKKLTVNNQGFYYLRPNAWCKHGPANHSSCK